MPTPASPLRLRSDRHKNEAALYAPGELMDLWTEIGRRSIYGQTYQLWHRGRPEHSKWWQTFVDMRAYFTARRINPRLYFQAIFDYAVWKRRHLTDRNPLSHDLRYTTKKLWRPWPSGVGSVYYLEIYDRWMRLGRGEEFAISEKQGAILGDLRPQRTRISEAFAQSAALVADFPRLYPTMARRDVLSIVFTELSPHFLYCLPDARPLVAKGFGTKSQRRVFEEIDANPLLQERYRSLFELQKPRLEAPPPDRVLAAASA